MKVIVCITWISVDTYSCILMQAHLIFSLFTPPYTEFGVILMQENLESGHFFK